MAERNPYPVHDDELVARVLTTPDGYNESTSTIVTGKLTQIYSLGLSMIRQGASNDEILSTVERLTSVTSEVRQLRGAVVFKAKKLREYDSNERWFGVYATDADANNYHADLFGTFPNASKNQQKRVITERRYMLAADLLPTMISATDPQDLLTLLRQAGI